MEDKEEVQRLRGRVDMSSHQEVFTALFNKVSSSPSSLKLLSILQSLTMLGPDQAELWQALDLITTRATLLAEEAPLGSVDRVIERLVPLEAASSSADRGQKMTSPAVQTDTTDNEQTNVLGSSPHLCESSSLLTFSSEPTPTPSPRPSDPLPAAIFGGPPELNYSSLEQVFGLSQTDSRCRITTASAWKPTKVISFIGAEKDMNLNIILKQFRCSNEEFVAMIQSGDRWKFDVEVLKQLHKLLPEKHEIESLTSFQGEHEKLANADRFYRLLIDVPCYALRIDCMIICQEAACVLEMLRPQVDLVARACDGLRKSTRLHHFCKLILDMGNFLNYGSHSGNAEGFRIRSLLKLTDTKGNKSHVTLLHHILEELPQNHSDLLNLPDDLEICEQAARVNLDSIDSEAKSLLSWILSVKKKVSSSLEDIKQQYSTVIQENEDACQDLLSRFALIEEKKTDLAQYQCEDPSALKLEELFGTMKAFRGLFLKALKETQSHREQAIRLEKRKQRMAEEEARRQTEDGGVVSENSFPGTETADVGVSQPEVHAHAVEGLAEDGSGREALANHVANAPDTKSAVSAPSLPSPDPTSAMDEEKSRKRRSFQRQSSAPEMEMDAAVVKVVVQDGSSSVGPEAPASPARAACAMPDGNSVDSGLASPSPVKASAVDEESSKTPNSPQSTRTNHVEGQSNMEEMETRTLDTGLSQPAEHSHAVAGLDEASANHISEAPDIYLADSAPSLSSPEVTFTPDKKKSKISKWFHRKKKSREEGQSSVPEMEMDAAVVEVVVQDGSSSVGPEAPASPARAACAMPDGNSVDSSLASPSPVKASAVDEESSKTPNSPQSTHTKHVEGQSNTEEMETRTLDTGLSQPAEHSHAVAGLDEASANHISEAPDIYLADSAPSLSSPEVTFTPDKKKSKISKWFHRKKKSREEGQSSVPEMEMDAAVVEVVVQDGSSSVGPEAPASPARAACAMPDGNSVDSGLASPSPVKASAVDEESSKTPQSPQSTRTNHVEGQSNMEEMETRALDTGLSQPAEHSHAVAGLDEASANHISEAPDIYLADSAPSLSSPEVTFTPDKKKSKISKWFHQQKKSREEEADAAKSERRRFRKKGCALQ